MSVNENEGNDSSDEDEERYAALPAAKCRSKRAILLKARRQRFCTKWENSFPWLKPDNIDESIGMCTICNKRLVCKKSHLERHEKTYKHQRSLGFEDVSVDCDDGRAQQSKKSALVDPEFLECGEQVSTEAIDEFEHAVKVDADIITENDLKENHVSREEAKAQSSSFKQTNSRSIEPCAKKSMKLDRMKLLRRIERDRNELNAFYNSYRQRRSSRTTPPQPTDTTSSRDAFDLFFDSVSASVKALPPKFAAEVKIRVSQIVAEYELRAICDRETIIGNSSTGLMEVGSTSRVSSTPIPVSNLENHMTNDATDANSEITTLPPSIMYSFEANTN